MVIPGFIAINQDNKIVSLKENGSDLTTIIIAKMLEINDVYLYKDVLGLSSIDPNLQNIPIRTDFSLSAKCVNMRMARPR